jgi:ribulose kinase
MSIGIDATCPLAMTDVEGNPFGVTKVNICGEYGGCNIISLDGSSCRNEANEINAAGSVVLDYVGGSTSVRVIEGSRFLYHQNDPRPSHPPARDGDS